MLFSQRQRGYKAGLLLLLVGIVLYIVGFSMPHWTNYSISVSSGSDTGMDYEHPFIFLSITGHNGLWQTCEQMIPFSQGLCGPVSPHHGAPDWVSTVQGFQTISLIGLIVSCVVSVIVNFTQCSPDKPYLEITIFVSGLLGFVGSIIYVSESSGNNDIVVTAEDLEMITHFLEINPPEVDKNELSWAFGLNLLGIFAALVSAVLLFAFGSLLPAPQEAPPVAVSFSAGATTAMP